jgi:Fe-S-cluster containining protein
MSGFLGVDRKEFLSSYCRRVAFGPVKRVSLTEKPNLDCVFWESGGCAVYEARPLQCRSFPFWSSQLGTREDWEGCAARCPGVGKGRLHDRGEIEGWLRLRLDEGFLES